MLYDSQGNYLFLEKFSSHSDIDIFMEIYNNLRKEWSSIFPDSNRNAGGVQFFNYILNNIKPKKEDFDIYNKLYCGVSGSLISPSRILNNGKFTSKNEANDLIRVKHINNGYVCGYYYRCCWPCPCDIMNESLVDVLAEDITLKLADGDFKYTVLTIPDPCSNSIIINDREVLPDPDDVSKSWNSVSAYNCIDKITNNATKTESNRIIFAVLFESKKCTKKEFESHVHYNSDLIKRCNERKNNQNNMQNWGMGDIFVNLAKKI